MVGVGGEAVLATDGGGSDGVGGNVVPVVDVRVGMGAPMMALGWMRVLLSMVRGAWMERMYARGWIRVLAPIVMWYVPLT